MKNGSRNGVHAEIIPDNNMPISSYVLQMESENREASLDALKKIPWVTIGESKTNGVPVVIESTSQQEAKERGETLADIPGISTALLVYHNFEDLQNCESQPTIERQ